MNEFDVAVLGAGISGISAAMRAAELEARVCLIEKSEIGGRCFHNGLYPYRHMMVRLARNTASSEEKEKGLAELQAVSHSVAEKWCAKLIDKGIQIECGQGVLSGPCEIKIQGAKEEKIIRAKKIIIATGSTVSASATIPFDAERIISADTVFQQRRIPASVLVLGGGKTGCELATLYSRLGSKTFLCAESPRLLSDQDPDVTEAVEIELKRQKIKTLLNKRVISIFKDDDKIDIALDGGVKFSVNTIVMTNPRQAQTEDLNAEAWGIRLGEKKQILVDETMQTSLQGVFAVGSVTGRTGHDCLSEEEGRVAAENALGKKAQVYTDWIPQIIYMTPEIATVGCYARDAHHKGFRAVEGKFNAEEGDYSLIHTTRPGFFKIVADKKSKKVIGGQIVAERASEIIPLILLAIKKGLPANSLARLASGSSTQFQGVREAAKACVEALRE